MDTLKPIEISFFTVSGLAATRVSPKEVSIGIKILGKLKTGHQYKSKTEKF